MGRLLLVRHGQASFGADDYDVLSDNGWAQARALGARLSVLGVSPDAVVHGSLARQRDTAAGLISAAGWQLAAEVDPRWDEFDHEAVVGAYGGADMRTTTRREFQQSFEESTARWTAAETPAASVESYAAFVARVGAALTDATARSGPGATVVAVSSGGCIAVAAALLVGAEGPALAPVWSRFNTVLVNASVSTVLVGATGSRLLTFNEHSHVSGDLLTYR